jgi:drug/metabolite transporter (DMT)-like permease
MATEPVSSTLAESGAASAAIVAKPNRFGVVFSFFSIYIIWGSTYLAILYAVETIPPLYTAGIRHLCAGIILFAVCLAKGLRPTWPQVRASIIIGFFFFLIGHGSLFWAETRIPSGLAALLVASEPIWMFLMTCAAERRWRMNLPLLGGVIVGLAGVGLLLGRDVWAAGTGVFLGAVACVVGGLSWSAGVVYARRSHLSGNPLLLSALSLLCGSVMLLVAGTALGEARGFHFSQVTPRSWVSLVYLILFGSIIAFTAYNWLMEHFPPTLVATHTYINPIVAVLLGWLLASEKMTVNAGIAAVMVVGAVILVERGMARLSLSS